MVNLKTLKAAYVKLDEKIAELDEDTFEVLGSDSVALGKQIEAFEKQFREEKAQLETTAKSESIDDPEFTCFTDNRDDCFNAGVNKGRRDVIKKILGETT